MYSWVYDGKKSVLYVDGKLFKKNMPMTTEYWFNKSKGIHAPGIDELRISRCARRNNA